MLTGEVCIVVHKHAPRLPCPHALLAAHLPGKFLRQLDIHPAPDRVKSALLLWVKQFFHSQRKHEIVQAGSHVEPGEMESGRGAGAGIFRVDHRDPADPAGAQDDLSPDTLLSGDQTGNRVADYRRFELSFVDPGRVQGSLDRFAGEVFQTALKVLAKAGHPGTDHCHLSHILASWSVRARVRSVAGREPSRKENGVWKTPWQWSGSGSD